MSKKIELVMMIDEATGKMFLEIESLIAWFEAEDENEALKQIGKYAAYTLRGMKEKSVTRPNRIMTEEEFREEHSQKPWRPEWEQ